MEYWMARTKGLAPLRGKVFLVAVAGVVVEAAPDFAWALGRPIRDVVAHANEKGLCVYVRQNERMNWRPVNED